MTKTAKNKQVMDDLYAMVTKSAAAGAKPTATGVPGKDTNVAAVSDKHDTVNQNAVKPENLAPQKHEQHASTDPAKPTGGKKAEEVAATETAPVTDAPKTAEEKTEPVAHTDVQKLGAEILALVNKVANNPVATGKPGADTKPTSVSEKTEHVDQNGVKPESNPQGYHQKPSSDPSKPVASAKAAEDKATVSSDDADKVASYELGKLWADMVLKQAQEQEIEQIKAAGRRDFEMLVAQASAQLNQTTETGKEKSAATVEAEEAEQIKQAEEAGAAAFAEVYKQAQAEYVVTQLAQQNQALVAKLAEIERNNNTKIAELAAKLAEKDAQMAKQAAEERENQKLAAWAEAIQRGVIETLKREVLPSR